MEHCPNCGGQLKIIAAIMEVVPDSNGPEDRLSPGPRQGLFALAAGVREDPHAPGSAGRLWTHDRACALACASGGPIANENPETSPRMKLVSAAIDPQQAGAEP